MKTKIINLCLASCLFFVAISGFALPQTHVEAFQKEEDSRQITYQKWGDFAVRMAKESFPSYDVSDYKYIGRQKKSGTTSQDQFELILTQDSKKRDVIVTILFNTQNGELISFNFEEK